MAKSKKIEISELLKVDVTPAFLNNVSSVLEVKKSGSDVEIHLPVIKAANLLRRDGVTFMNQLVDGQYDSKLIKNVACDVSARASTKIVFQLDKSTFVQNALSYQENLVWLTKKKPETVIVEYSSPNIAKPFHVGHLRSTIIGNFLANIEKYLGKNVVRINYLGDWGTQFGLLKLGIEMIGLSDAEVRSNPIQNLYRAYVSGNQAASVDKYVAEKAKRYFRQLEDGLDAEEITRWEQYRKFTIEELQNVYSRLGIEFDTYEWESQYGQQQIQSILNTLESKGILVEEIDGRKIAQIGDRRVPVVKSDGSTLYLARDVAALMDRSNRYSFDKMLYVVDNAQTDHFNACFHIAKQLDPAMAERLTHIKFGRVRGMSTRTGNVIFLNNVLDEARDITMQKQLQSPTTKIDVTSELDKRTADILGVSAVIVNDLKQRRQRDYDFDWDKALQTNGDTGVKLQYTHCRLCSLIKMNDVVPAEIANSEYLSEPEALNLIVEIARYPEAVLRAQQRHEACELVNYLFCLSNTISRALKKLNVKNCESKEVQSQRILLFVVSRKILHDGMEILGLKPLEEM